MMPVPRVSVRNCDRNPISPRAGMRNSRRTRPLPWFTIFVITPLRVPVCAMTTPWKSSGTSMTNSSTGSTSTWSIVLVTISGRETCTSKPSRRIISMRMDSCSSPRPMTFTCSGESVFSTRRETLPSSSRSSRSRRLRDVTYWPSRPARGDVLTPKIIDTVGSSIAIGGIATRFSMSATVSPIVMSSMPARHTISPAPAASMSTRLRPSKENSLVIFVSCWLPSSFSTATCEPTATRPLNTRPIAMRPR